MSIATLIRRMTEAGAPPEAIALAVEEIEALQGSLDARRAADRDRKREQRERQKSANVTGQSEDSHNVVRLRVSPDKEKSPIPPKEINPIPHTIAREAGFHRMPEGWRPTRPFPAELQAKVDQWPPGKLDDVIACLKRWAANAPDQAGKGRKKDWDKFCWNWLTREHDERRTPTIGKSQAAYASLSFGADEAF
jgi:hypothetical protein